ncbi:MAG: hypothetical protein ACOYVG_06105 [Bacteroidota bacterium]
MKPLRAIQYKALFLLITFSMNTVVGFACSMGVDMGFNSGSHKHEGEGNHKHEGQAQEHRHGGGSHKHNGEGAKKHQHDDHTKAPGHHHDKASPKHSHQENNKSGKGNTAFYAAPADENCCNNFVVGYQNLDKQLTSKASSDAKPKFDYASFTTQSITIFVQPVYKEPVKTPPKFLPFHSPPDIRIFIQSFQI